MALIQCPECGKEISDKATACPNCGCPVTPVVPAKTEDDERKEALEQFNARMEQKEKADERTKKIIIPVCAVLCIIVVIVIVAFIKISNSPKTNLKNLEGIYSGLYYEGAVEYASDGKSMTIDTNPNDVDDCFYSEIYDDVKSVNEQLGLPSSLIEKMEATRALDGRQQESYGKVTVSWTYHPDNGLEVLYELK